MQNLNNIKSEIVGMAKIALEMWRITFQSFMEHDPELFPQITERENKLNDLEKSLTQQLVELSKATKDKAEKENIALFTGIVGDIELIGDYCKDILERIEIKVQEKLLFSEDAVAEYKELYQKTADALEEVVRALEKGRLTLAKEIVRESADIERLVEHYRKHHNQRLLEGICSPFACNMFLNMIDFTAAIYFHTKKIAENLTRIK